MTVSIYETLRILLVSSQDELRNQVESALSVATRTMLRVCVGGSFRASGRLGTRIRSGSLRGPAFETIVVEARR